MDEVKRLIALYLILMALAGAWLGWRLNDAYNELRQPALTEPTEAPNE